VPVIRFARMNQCSSAAEEAARVALARGVFREGLTPEFTGGHAKHGRPCATTS
jgi:hypothetical protein